MTYLIVGLGNPGEKYENSRHNAGFMVLDLMAGSSDWSADSIVKGVSYKDKIGKNEVWFLKPHTMMNKSGLAVSKLALKHKVKPENIIVIHDDIDLPLGRVKIVKGRGSGGHRGVESVKRCLKTKDFIRVRVGVTPATPTGKIRKPHGEDKVLGHLLGDFKKAELKKLSGGLKLAAEATEAIIGEGLVVALNNFN